MAENTKNLGLIKPAAEDFYNVEDFNQNFQKIDDFVGGKGYYIGNVDELKQPGTYIIVIDDVEGIEMSGSPPLDGGWYTVNVSVGGTGSIIQDWVMNAVPGRRFFRHFDGINWSEYFEFASTQSFPTPGKVLAKNMNVVSSNYYKDDEEVFYTIDGLSKYNMIAVFFTVDLGKNYVYHSNGPAILIKTSDYDYSHIGLTKLWRSAAVNGYSELNDESGGVPDYAVCSPYFYQKENSDEICCFRPTINDVYADEGHNINISQIIGLC